MIEGILNCYPRYIMKFRSFIESDEEKVVQAAFSIEGRIYPSGPFHDSSIIPESEYGKEWIDGFLTNKGRFLTRKEAAIFVSGEAGGKYRTMDASELKSGPVAAYRPA